MKKNVVSLFAATLLICFSCMDQGMNPTPNSNLSSTQVGSSGLAPIPINLLPDMTGFNNLIAPEVDIIFNYNDIYLYRIQNDMLFNYERFMRDRAAVFVSGFSANWNVTIFVDPIKIQPPPSVFKKPSQIANASSVYTAKQLSILDTYSTTLYNATTLEQIVGAQSYVRQAISTGNFTFEQKYALMAFVSCATTLASDFFTTGVNGVKQVIIETGTPGSSLNCKVNWRSVWAGAVVGGVVGAVRGASVGAAGGTVAFPGLGTASGAVGGGVLGFATGFTGGAATGVVSELLTSCFSARYDITPNLYDCQTFEQIKSSPNCLEQLDNKALFETFQP